VGIPRRWGHGRRQRPRIGRPDRGESPIGEGVEYDNLGRITSLPGADAGGHTLTTSYFSNEMVASQSQNGITNTFALDATGRQRQRTQTGGGLEGAEIFHYAGGSDSPAWTQRGSTWTRNITGIGGELAAVQESGKEAVLQLCDLHGLRPQLRGGSSGTPAWGIPIPRSGEYLVPWATWAGNPIRGAWGFIGRLRRSGRGVAPGNERGPMSTFTEASESDSIS
jgi:hypothetical protein